MSSIDKLLIRGIRSFSPYNENVIEFYTPLTIIVGHNGAGKTTIIECLKYATTGDLPPNSKGGAFVHDPKVSREIEVKGQIKLKFKNARGQTMVCTRSMQSTQKRTKLEQKTLESLLATTDRATGEQVSISSRCAEMDAEIPLQLGVSRAVLEDVLFCHQEESFWPLSEPSVLKKKFDDIFAATRYTKALETLKSLRKELVSELKLEQQKLDYLKADKEKAARLELEVEKIEIRKSEGQSCIESIEAQLNELNVVIERLSSDLKNLSDLQSELERTEHDIQVTRQSQADLFEGLKMMNEPYDNLLALLEQCSKRTLADGNILDKLRSEKSTTETQISEQSRLFNCKSTEIGVLEAEMSRLTERESARLEMLERLCQELGVPISNNVSQTAMTARGKINEQKKTLELAQVEIKETEMAFSNRLQFTSLRISSATEKKRMKRKAIEEAQQRLGSVLDQIADAASSKDQLDDLQLRLLDEEVALNQALEFFAAASYESRLQVLAQRRKELEAEIVELDRQVVTSSRFADVRAKLDVKKIEYERKSELISRTFNDIKAELGENVAIESAERESERVWREKDRQVKALQERSEKANQAASIISSKREHAQSLHVRKEQDMTEKLLRIQQVCGDDDFGMLFEETESEFNQLSAELATLLSSRATYEAFTTLFSKNQACPLCERSFESRMEGELFSKKLSKFLEALPANALDVENKKRQFEDKLNVLKGLRTISDDIDRLRLVELPELSSELRRLGEECSQSQSALEDISSELSSLVLEEKKLALVKRRGEEVGKLNREINLLCADMEKLEGELRLGGVKVDAQAIQERLTNVHTEQQRVNHDLDTTNNEMQTRRAELLTRETRFRDIKEHIMKIQLLQSDLIRLEQNKSELESSLSQLDQEITVVDSEMISLSGELEAVNTEKEKTMFDIIKRESESHMALVRSEDLYRDFTTIDGEVSRLQQTCDRNSLASLINMRFQHAAELQTLQRELDAINEKIAMSNQVASEAVVQERNVRDNLKYRELEARINSLESEKARVKGKLGSFDRYSTTTQLQRNEMRHSELLGERSGIFGELRQLSDQCSRLRQELATDYSDTLTSYRAQYVRHVAMTTAVEDLEKYAAALDQAIMRFHSHKMAEVNRIIREIWTSTYQGADIDAIEMRTETEGTTTGRPSYNYRLVMLKGDTELDMRGRSSAGQRVLASLVIRLALAETFGQHCGVLALDEPTTNLDRENIESLAIALAEIIKMRQRQGNFQLIIITHDEEFVDLLGRHECADYYWRVAKDESQYSTIERQSFRGVE
jgi:DNA repair protein RAD50